MKSRSIPLHRHTSRGFTLIELMIVVAVAAILAAIALPSYAAYVVRAKVPPGLFALSSFGVRMEQRYQDTGNYGTPNCAVAVPAADSFTVTCTISANGQAFTATATGRGRLEGYVYSIDHQGTHTTVSHPLGVPATACWTIRGTTCDS